MVTPNNPATSISFFFFFFFLSVFLSCPIAALSGSRHHRNCTSSCGSLRNISYPLRLIGDSRECGEIELSCDGKNASLNGGLEALDKYFVTGIDYANNTLTLLHAGLAEAGECRVPNPPFASNDFPYNLTLTLSYHLANFINCSERIQSPDNLIVPLPCFGGNNRSMVYAALGSGMTSELPKSCSFLASFPIQPSSVSGISSETELFQQLQKGFLAVWHIQPKATTICWRETVASYKTANFSSIVFFPRVFNESFLDCLSRHEIEIGITDWCLAMMMVYLRQFGWMVIYIRFIIGPITVFVFLAHKFWTTRREVDTVERFLRTQQAMSPARYAYSDLVAMTKNFKEKLGQGGFGSVFKGRLYGVIPVAVKMLGGSKLNGEEFISEVSTIGRIHHANVVRLLGFCSEGSKRALIYEYMPNGSLDKYIFDGGSPLALEKLNEIALGAARGIDYLHRGCEVQILHFDIKPHNVLLDSNFVPKVADFGLAKLYPKEHSRVSVSAARGTIGYIAPELVSRSFGVVSSKSDVFSFGMLLMDMAGKGRRYSDFGAAASSQAYFPSWIYDKLLLEQEGVSITEIGEVERKLLKVGLWCIQMKPFDRPAMSKVLEMLQGNADDIQMPPRPFFSSSEPTSARYSSLPTSTSAGELSIIFELHDLS